MFNMFDLSKLVPDFPKNDPLWTYVEYTEPKTSKRARTRRPQRVRRTGQTKLNRPVKMFSKTKLKHLRRKRMMKNQVQRQALMRRFRNASNCS